MAEMVFLTKLKPEPMGKYNASKAYGINSLVMSEDGAAAYLSVKDVPAGTPLTNAEYWKIHTDLSQPKQNAEVAAERAIAARDEMWEALRNLTDPVTAEGNPVEAELVGGMPFDSVKTLLEPKQDGSGEPSPSNVRPISGWTGAKITRAGKNLFPCCEAASYTSNGVTFTSDGSGVYTIKGTAGASASATVTWPLKESFLAADGWYCHLMNDQANANVSLDFRDGTGAQITFLSTSQVNRVYKFESLVGKKVEKIVLYVAAGKTVDMTLSPMFLTSDAASDFVPYRSNAYEADFGQTVYGGSLDWQTGELTVDRAMITLNGTQTVENRFKGSHGAMIVRYSAANAAAIASSGFDARLICSALKAVSADSQYMNKLNTVACNNSPGSVLVCIEGLTTEAEVTAWLAANPVTVVYPITTPIVIQLTPWQIKQLEGTNTLYGDGLIRIEGRQERVSSGGGGTGEDGGYYTPAVSNEGELTWEASKSDMPKAPSANIRGPKGEDGSSGVYIGEDEPTDPNVNVWIKPDGEIAQEDTWELIETIAGAGAVITRTKEPNGTPYKFKAMIARVNNNGVAVNTSLYAKSRGTFIGAGYHTSTDARKMFAIEVRQDHGWWISDNYLPNSSAVQYAGTSRASESFMFKHSVKDYPDIDTFTTSAVIPADVVVEIWGLRA